MTEQEYQIMRGAADMHEEVCGDLPDGAFFAIAEEAGIDYAAMADYEGAFSKDKSKRGEE